MDSAQSLYTLTFDSRPEYLYVFAQGNLAAPETRIEAWRTIISRCRVEKYSRLLVVQESPGNATPADAYTSSAGIAAIGLLGIKIAFVDLDPAHHEINTFGELVAANRGAVAKVFTVETEALTWLMKETA